MLTEYIEAAMKRAKYKLLADDEGYFGTIPGFRGLWGHADTLRKCRKDLRGALESWLIVSFRLDMNVPVVAGINLNQRKPRRRKVA
jgi:predicted RNase H-like HicB family nuclease